MKISLIISVYKNVAALRVVLNALRYQTYTDFEIIVSEDGDDPAMSAFVKSYQSLQPIMHLSQPDEGWRKNRALNQAVLKSRGSYLIFVDGDCVLHHRFIEEHKRLSSPTGIVAGKRIKLGPKFSNHFLEGQKDFLVMEMKIATQLKKMKRDGARFIEEGIYVDPNGPYGFIAAFRKMKNLKGCNMSFYKNALESINGFDEDYILPAVGEDVDLWWRFKASNYEMISARHLAVQYHLYHVENWCDQSVNLALMQQKKINNVVVCLNGLKKLIEIKPETSSTK